MDGMLGEKFAVEDGAEHELGAHSSTMDFQWLVMSVLTGCLTQGHNSSFFGVTDDPKLFRIMAGTTGSNPRPLP